MGFYLFLVYHFIGHLREGDKYVHAHFSVGMFTFLLMTKCHELLTQIIIAVHRYYAKFM